MTGPARDYCDCEDRWHREGEACTPAPDDRSAQMSETRPGAYVARVWDLGRPQEVHRRHDGGLTMEVVTPEGHVVQALVTADGEVSVRAWRHDDLYDNGGSNRTIFTASGYLPSEPSR